MYRRLGIVAVLLLCWTLSSCSKSELLDEVSPVSSGGMICFSVSSEDQTMTRGETVRPQSGKTNGRFVLRSDGSADTLCVRSIVSDGIEPLCRNGKDHTRGELVIGIADFYEQFHVLAYRKTDGILAGDFYMDEDAIDYGSYWNPESIYLWPGLGHTLQFYAWAPNDAGSLDTPSSPSSKSLTYTVPSNATLQKDLMVATTSEIAGNSNLPVDLEFNHICTAVNFVVGSQMQPGKIISVALKGVRNAGTFDMSLETWSLENSTYDFTQTLNMQTTGSEPFDTQITPSAGTFLMLPQTLPAGAAIQVVFEDASGVTKTLSASIAGTEWYIGTTQTYEISITPDYGMSIQVPSTPQDAHYISFPITVNVEDYTGNWTLTSNQTSNVFFTATRTDLQSQGYWIDEDKGSSSVTGRGSGSFTYYVYVTENASETARYIQFQLTPDTPASAVPVTATVTQLCPSWNGTLGCERIEDGDYPWGFMWDGITVKYTISGIGDALVAGIVNLLGMASYDWCEVNYSYFIVRYISSIVIHFDQLDATGVADSATDGKTNTEELYDFNGMSAATDLMNALENYGLEPDREPPLNPLEFAARACVMKNRFSKTTSTQGGRTVEVPVLDPDDLVWYLPAKNEAPLMSDGTYSLNGDYWTSTAAPSLNSQAYKYVAGQSSVPESNLTNRDQVLHVRAIRQKP